MRGFAAALISICTFIAALLSLLVNKIADLYEVFNIWLKETYNYRITTKVSPEEEENRKKKVENTYDKANKINSFRDDFYAITFVGYVYLTIE